MTILIGSLAHLPCSSDRTRTFILPLVLQALSVVEPLVVKCSCLRCLILRRGGFRTQALARVSTCQYARGKAFATLLCCPLFLGSINISMTKKS
jgi:hypothetical protein